MSVPHPERVNAIMPRSLRLIPVFGVLVAGAAALAALPPSPAGAPAEFKPYSETVPGTALSFEMIPIPAGTFLMGSPPGEKDRGDNEGPQHPVTVGAFWMAKLETTWNLYDLYWKDEKITEGDKRRDDPVVTA